MMQLRSLVTDGPDTQVSTPDTLAFLSSVLPPGTVQRYCDFATASGIQSRRAVAPLEELARLVTFEERNALYAQHAVPLAERAARRALEHADATADALDTLIVTSSSGYMIPGLDCHVAARLGLRADARCLALSGLGCAGAVRAIGLADDLLRGRPGGSALVVAVELCSPWLQLGEASPEDMYSNLLFGDGVGAVFLAWSRTPRTPTVIAHHSEQWPESLAARSAMLTSTGLRHHSSPRLPRMIAIHLQRTISEFLAREGWQRKDLGFVAVNVSDPRCGTAVADLLDLPTASLSAATEVWRRHGNILSAGPLHLLRQIATASHPSDDSLGLLVALGPGITCHLLLFRWQGNLTTMPYGGSEGSLQ
jgi:alkylresorcinol/alkylpyrone synthase